MPVPIWAGRYIGLPFREHGRDRAGLDCWGLVRLVMAEQYGLSLPSFAARYRRTSDGAGIGRLVLSEIPKWDEVKGGAEAEGDVIVLRARGEPMHVGLVLGDGCMLHVEAGIDSAIERYRGPRWAERIFGFFRHREPSDGDSRF
jgi:cell wall-associated NlpC family hydrolase